MAIPFKQLIKDCRRGGDDHNTAVELVGREGVRGGGEGGRVIDECIDGLDDQCISIQKDYLAEER